jgi:soluble lytic murein transglycosylase-like protein
MPKRWTTYTSHLAASAKRTGEKYGFQTAIIIAGAAIVVGTAGRPIEAHPAPPLVNRVAALAPPPTAPFANLKPTAPFAHLMPTAPFASLTSAPDTTPKLALDNGIEHSRIDKWISRFASSIGFKQALERKDKYDDMITAKLDAKQMPRDLIYLAMIESDFDPHARSPVSAVGMWQFMRATARRFGLTVRGKVDERKDPARSTDAALTYLSSLYDRFGSWYLAAAAYNSGEGTVSKALKRVTGKKTGTDADFFKIMPALPKETRDYVPKLIAATRVGNDPEKYGVGTK